MSGFVDRKSNRAESASGIKAALSKLINLGADYTDMVIRQSRLIGPAEASILSGASSSQDPILLAAAKLQDSIGSKNLAFFEQDYATQRNLFRSFAKHPEIQYFLDIIVNEMLVFDDKRFFALPDVAQLSNSNHLEAEKLQEITVYLETQYKRLYSAFKLAKNAKTWAYKWLVDGYLALELVYNDELSEIIGARWIDAITLDRGVYLDSKTGNLKEGWVQYPNDEYRRREIPDEMLVYIPYVDDTEINRLSYIASLIHPFNMLRHVEHAKVMWTLIHSAYRMKMVVPVGMRARAEVDQSIERIRNLFKEEINLDSDSGEISYNGTPKMQFYKNYVLPAPKDGQQIEISSMPADGPDLSDTNSLKYWMNKLIIASKIPPGRLNSESGGGTFASAAEGIAREEIMFYHFVNDLRSKFQEIILKPLLIQFGLQYPHLVKDPVVVEGIGLRFNKNNFFEEAKRADLLNNRAGIVSALKGIMGDDGQTPFLPTKWLLKNIMHFTEHDFIEIENIRIQEQKPAAGGGQDGQDGGGGGDMGGGGGMML